MINNFLIKKIQYSCPKLLNKIVKLKQVS